MSDGREPWTQRVKRVTAESRGSTPNQCSAVSPMIGWPKLSTGSWPAGAVSSAAPAAIRASDQDEGDDAQAHHRGPVPAESTQREVRRGPALACDFSPIIGAPSTPDGVFAAFHA
ncbi:hypothetical protein GCM10009828_000140 [Actinoplanes couchii]